MTSIGGYFELELPQKQEYHRDAISLNTGRNAFEYILRTKKYNKIILPYYFCDVMLEPIHKLDLSCEYYHIDKTFRPLFEFNDIRRDEVFIYINYFGLCDAQVGEIAKKCQSLIIDNCQAFFSKPLSNVDTFYSPRKFFGVPDGAYLYTNLELNVDVEKDISFSRFEHLLGRIDIGAEEYLKSHKKNESLLVNQPIKIMSKITKRLLGSIDNRAVVKKRRENYFYLHKALKDTNQLNLSFENDIVPMVYPLLVEDGMDMKKWLIRNNIFVATYWPTIIRDLPEKYWEYHLAMNIVPLPVDQRNSKESMEKIVTCVLTKEKT